MEKSQFTLDSAANSNAIQRSFDWIDRQPVWLLLLVVLVMQTAPHLPYLDRFPQIARSWRSC